MGLWVKTEVRKFIACDDRFAQKPKRKTPARSRLEIKHSTNIDHLVRTFSCNVCCFHADVDDQPQTCLLAPLLLGLPENDKYHTTLHGMFNVSVRAMSLTSRSHTCACTEKGTGTLVLECERFCGLFWNFLKKTESSC